ncbi:MAG: type IV pilus secretin PilQ [Betaproteobacteria bacterium]|nr:type IV pilus secretin PilQ [Betaproteobacteria bacterium]
MSATHPPTPSVRGRRSLPLVVLVCGLLHSALTWADNSIDAVAVSRGTAGRTVIKMTLKEPMAAAPAGFSISNPPRIALDFPNTGNSTGKAVQEVGDAVLRSLNIVQAGTRTRVVLNLVKTQNFETQLSGRDLFITLFDQPTGDQAGTATVSHFSEAKGAEPGALSLKDIDFRRGVGGEGRIIVELSSANTGIDIRQQGEQLIVDFVKTGLPRNLQRKMDVIDFATPVVSIDTFLQAGNARMVIQPKGLWEHSAYQAENRFILEIKPIIEDPNKLTQGSRPGYKGDKLSLNFQNVEVRSVLQVIADFTGLNIITSDTVQGNLTLRLKDIPWDQALDIIMQTKGLDMRKNGSVVLIAPREELATKEKLELEARQQIGELEPIHTELFQLNYKKASELRDLLVGTGAGGGGAARNVFLSKRGSASFDARTNTLIVQDTGARLEEIRKLIGRIDITVRQVLIEARIVIADDKFSKQLGVRLGSLGGYRVGNNNIGLAPRIENSNTSALGITPNQSLLSSSVGGVTQFGEAAGYPVNVNLPISNPAGSLAVSILNLGSGNLINLELQAMEANNLGKVVSNPRVVTADNQKALIKQGTQIPYTTGGGIGTPPTTQFKDAVLELSVTPQITPDNRIIMLLEIKKDSVGALIDQGGGLGKIPSIDVRNITTQIVVNNGDTAVIGGIFEGVSRKDVSKVPFLGDLPWVGNLFKTTANQEDKVEMLIFITPRIVQENINALR